MTQNGRQLGGTEAPGVVCVRQEGQPRVGVDGDDAPAGGLRAGLGDVLTARVNDRHGRDSAP